MAPENTGQLVENPKPADGKIKLNKKIDKKWNVFLVAGVAAFLAGAGCTAFALLKPQADIEALNYPTIPSKSSADATYSDLTGAPLSDGVAKDAPMFCIQVPNGTDGARPQAGLTEAGVVFEAIAEAGITRFAALFQSPKSSIIGPIRSLRLYYLEWDTPFNCTIVHAGGADDALAAVRSGGYSDLSEDYNYMYRGTYGSRLWNNLFTTSTYLSNFSQNTGKTTSHVKGFARMTPEESSKSRVDKLVSEKLNITKTASGSTSELAGTVNNINLNFGSSATFNVSYAYDTESNTYKRSYGIGSHEVYSCPDGDQGERNPEDICSLTQMAPSVVVAMVVSERRAADNYHEDITTIGSGKAYIFQNGIAEEGTWNKASRDDQIVFKNGDGEEIKLAPGQTFVSAIPEYGSIEF